MRLFSLGVGEIRRVKFVKISHKLLDEDIALAMISLNKSEDDNNADGEIEIQIQYSHIATCLCFSQFSKKRI